MAKKIKVKGHRRSDGVKVKGYTRYDGKKISAKKIAKRARTYREALEKSKTSKSGHKSWRERIKDEKAGKGKAGLWAHVHAAKARKKRKR
jgi:hypothetical protein